MRVAALGAVLMFLGGPRAEAHQFWLSPVTYPEGEAAEVRVYAFVGEGLRGEPVRYSAPYAASFFQRVPSENDCCGKTASTAAVRGGLPCLAAAGLVRNLLVSNGAVPVPPATIDLAARASHGDVTFARLDEAAGSVVSFVSHFTPHEMDGIEFDAYLASEGLTAPLETRARLADRGGLVRERFRRSAKLWLPGPVGGSVRGRVGDSTGSSPRVDPCARLGLPLEIAPLEDPVDGGEVRFQVWYQGEPLSGAQVRVWHAPDAAVAPAARSTEAEAVRFAGRTAEDGTVALAVDEPGEWLVAVVHMVASESADADWESTWSSFTFHVR